MVTIVGSYLAVAVVVAVVVNSAADAEHAPSERAWLSVIAGLAWPVLLVGVVEFAVVAACAGAFRAQSTVR